MNHPFNVLPMFAMPIYQAMIGVDQTDREQLINERFTRISVGNGDISHDKYILENTRFANLKQKLLENINFFLKERLAIANNVEFFITNSWIMKHYRGDWSNKHFHENSLLSGIYYVQCDQISGDVGFVKPDHYLNLFPSVFGFKFNSHNEFNSKEWWFTPREGELFLFPSHLEHVVDPSESDRDRICIAFNVWMKGNLELTSHEEIGTLNL